MTVFLILSPVLLPRADVRGWRLMYCVLAAIGGALLFRRFDEGNGPMALAAAYLVVATPAVVIAGRVYLRLLHQRSERVNGS